MFFAFFHFSLLEIQLVQPRCGWTNTNNISTMRAPLHTTRMVFYLSICFQSLFKISLYLTSKYISDHVLTEMLEIFPRGSICGRDSSARASAGISKTYFQNSGLYVYRNFQLKPLVDNLFCFCKFILLCVCSVPGQDLLGFGQLKLRAERTCLSSKLGKVGHLT